MGEERWINIRCPSCGAVHPFLYRNTVDSSRNPELVPSVMDLSIFRFFCPDCGKTAELHYDFLLNLVERHLLIYFGASEQSIEAACNTFLRRKTGPTGVYLEDCVMRVVRKPQEMVEKVNIFNASLDDRIVELFKTTIPVIYRPGVNHQWIFRRTGGKNYIDVTANGETVTTMELTQKEYNRLLEEYGPSLLDVGEVDTIIDRDWALEFLDDCWDILLGTGPRDED